MKRRKLYNWNWITFSICLAVPSVVLYYVEMVEFKTTDSWIPYVVLAIAALFSIDERDAGTA